MHAPSDRHVVDGERHRSALLRLDVTVAVSRAKTRGARKQIHESFDEKSFFCLHFFFEQILKLAYELIFMIRVMRARHCDLNAKKSMLIIFSIIKKKLCCRTE